MSLIVDKIITSISKLKELVVQEPERFIVYRERQDPIVIDKETGIVYWIDEL
jgi:hypothetical protein